MRKKGLDIDGVILNFTDHFFSYLGLPAEPIDRWENDTIGRYFHRIENDEQFWLTMPKHEDTGIEDIDFFCYITARPICSTITQESLKLQGFPDKPVYSVGMLRSKVDICLELGITDFVDDRPKNVLELADIGINSYLWDREWNRYFNWENRINHLTQINGKDN